MRCKFSLFFLLYIVLIIPDGIKAQGNSAYEGTRFLVGFMQNEIGIQPVGGGLILQLFITAREETALTVKLPFTVPMNYLLPPDSVLIVRINNTDFQDTVSEISLPKAIIVTSDLPITIYVYNSQLTTTDTYAALPVNSWGKEYVVMSYPNDQYPYSPFRDSLSDATPRRSEFMVLADFDSTVIQFRPNAVTDKGKQIFNTYTALLNKGDEYLVKSFNSPVGTADLTGTIVKSNKPVGFLSGHERTSVLQFTSNSNKNHLVEMLQPVPSWGRNFCTAPYFDDTFESWGDLIRITGYYPNTNVYMMNDAGVFKSFNLKDSGSVLDVKYVDNAVHWISDKPIQMGQYMQHSGLKTDNIDYDPSYAIVPPAEQFVNRILFQTPGNPIENPDQFIGHGAIIIAEEKALPTLKYDNTIISSFYNKINSQIIPGTTYHWARLDVTVGKHEIFCDKGKFAGILFGYGNADAYSHIIGSSLNNPYIKDSTPPDISFNFMCGKLNGRVYEEINGNNSGIANVTVILDSTYNFTWKITPVNDTTTEVLIGADVQDVTNDARIVIDIRDKNGNGGRYAFFYNKLNFIINPKFQFKNVDSQDSTCQEILIVNNGKDSLDIKDIYLVKNDVRLRYKLNRIPPFFLHTNDTLSGIICFDPRGDTTFLDNQLVVIMDCNLINRIPITGNVFAYDVYAEGYDFGIVRVGDTACADIYIVNKGNVKLTIDELSFPGNNSFFDFDTSGIFPKVIQPGDTLKIKVCFLPDSVKYFETTVKFIDRFGINKRVIVKGSGGAPNIESITIDWGKRRVGTKNDSTFYLINNGNYKADIIFNSYPIYSNVFDTINISAIKLILNSVDSINISTAFSPDSSLLYTTTAKIDVDWKYHKPLNINLSGYGTQPLINTFDIVFDTIHVFSTKDSLAAIIKAGGNEQLTIDSIVALSGDISSFVIDYSKLVNLILQPDSILIIPVQFAPKRIGYHEMLLEVTSDADSNYHRIKSYIKVSGNVIPNDTVDLRMILDGNTDLNFCQKSRLNLTLSNHGNIILNLSKIDLKTQSLSGTWITAPVLPFKLMPDSILTFGIEILSTTENTGKVIINATANDTILKNIEQIINFKKYQLIVDNFSGFKGTPGDSVQLNISGTFPTWTEQLLDFNLSLEADNRSFGLLNKNPDLNINRDGIIEKINCNAQQNLTNIIINPKKSIILQKNKILWNIELPLFVYLNDDKFPLLKLYVSTNDCFDSLEQSVNAEISDVCVFGIRMVQAINNVSGVEISPNPVVENLSLDIYLSDDDYVNLKIFDQLGKKYYDFEKIFLKKGINSRIFEISLLTNGVYVLNLQTSAINLNKMFIILK